MRVSASSSFLIATLAISTSSPCLGAPTVDQQGERLSSFNSVRNLKAMPGGKVMNTQVQSRELFDARELRRRGLLKSLLGGLPLIGPLVAGVDDTLCGGASGQAFGVESMENSGPTEEQIVQMMEAAYTLSNVYVEAMKATPLVPATSTASATATVTSMPTPTPTGTETSTENSSTETASTENAMATPMSADSDPDSRILVAPDLASVSSLTMSTSTMATATSTSTVVAEGVMPTPPIGSAPMPPDVDAPKPPASPPVDVAPPSLPIQSPGQVGPAPQIPNDPNQPSSPISQPGLPTVPQRPDSPVDAPKQEQPKMPVEPPIQAPLA